MHIQLHNLLHKNHFAKPMDVSFFYTFVTQNIFV